MSGTYYPTSPETLHELYAMADKISEFELKNELFIQMISPMKEKFRKYFYELPSVFTCALALNPCYNVTGVETVIDEINFNLGFYEDDVNWSTRTKESFKTSFQSMYDSYLTRYGPNAQFPVSSGTSVGSSSSRTSKSKHPRLNLINTVRNETAKRQRGAAPLSELALYKATDFISTYTNEDFEQFDLLAWWKGKENAFPILATMARDLLTVQASTVASESAFSLSGRILSIRRTKLTAESVEMCICLKDHLDAADRIQHISSLEEETMVEAPILDEEVEEGLSDPLTEDEENDVHSVQDLNSE